MFSSATRLVGKWPALMIEENEDLVGEPQRENLLIPIDEHLERGQWLVDAHVTYDVQIWRNEQWVTTVITDRETLEEAARLLDDLILSNPFMTEIVRARVVKVTRQTVFEHIESNNENAED
jgi:hypothetical protein